MKNAFNLIFLLLLVFPVNAQQEYLINGKIIDAKTKEILPFASITYNKKLIGTSSNKNGFFKLFLANAYKKDSITISYLGYKDLKLSIDKSTKTKVFLLIPEINTLNEIVVKSEQFKVKPFMRKVINNYNKDRREIPHIAKAHYREKAKENGKYVMFMESIGYTVYTGKMTNLTNYKFFYEDTRCFINHPEWKKYASFNNSNVAPSGGLNLNTFRRIELNGLLSKENFKKFKFKKDSTFFIGGRKAHAISFKGKKDKGSVIVFSNKQVYKINCITDKYYANVFRKRIKANVTIQFTYFEKTPFLSSINSSFKHKEVTYFNDLNILLQKINEFKIEKKEYNSFNGFNINPFIEYNPERWGNIKNDDDFKDILKDFNLNASELEKVFEESSDKWFFPKAAKFDAAMGKIRELKTLFL